MLSWIHESQLGGPRGGTLTKVVLRGPELEGEAVSDPPVSSPEPSWSYFRHSEKTELSCQS